MNFNDTQHLNMTSPEVINSGIKMGLDNQPCKDPKYFCICHKIYLSDADVKTKHCMHKLSKDMIEYEKCNWLIESKKYDETMTVKNQTIAKVRHFYS